MAVRDMSAHTMPTPVRIADVGPHVPSIKRSAGGGKQDVRPSMSTCSAGITRLT
jgi:hypothetical protein